MAFNTPYEKTQSTENDELIMHKQTLGILIATVVVICALILWFKMPNSTEKTLHRSIFCNVIRDPKIALTTQDLLENFRFNFNNSLPTYAYHKPKFYEHYADTVVRHYLILSNQQKQIAKKDFDQCVEILK